MSADELSEAVVRTWDSSVSVSSDPSGGTQSAAAPRYDANPRITHGARDVEPPEAPAGFVPCDRVLDGKSPATPHWVMGKCPCHDLGDVLQIGSRLGRSAGDHRVLHPSCRAAISGLASAVSVARHLLCAGSPRHGQARVTSTTRWRTEENLPLEPIQVHFIDSPHSRRSGDVAQQRDLTEVSPGPLVLMTVPCLMISTSPSSK